MKETGYFETSTKTHRKWCKIPEEQQERNIRYENLEKCSLYRINFSSMLLTRFNYYPIFFNFCVKEKYSEFFSSGRMFTPVCVDELPSIYSSQESHFSLTYYCHVPEIQSPTTLLHAKLRTILTISLLLLYPFLFNL